MRTIIVRRFFVINLLIEMLLWVAERTVTEHGAIVSWNCTSM